MDIEGYNAMNIKKVVSEVLSKEVVSEDISMIPQYTKILNSKYASKLKPEFWKRLKKIYLTVNRQVSEWEYNPKAYYKNGINLPCLVGKIKGGVGEVVIPITPKRMLVKRNEEEINLITSPIVRISVEEVNDRNKEDIDRVLTIYNRLKQKHYID